MRLDQVPRLVRTMRHLRSSQLWWRTRYLVERQWPLSLLGFRVESPRPARVAPQPGPFPAVPLFHRLGPTGSAAVDLLARGEFQHLRQTVKLGRLDPNWLHGGDDAGRLWSITLHYHGWVYDLAEAAVAGDERALPLLQHLLDHWWSHCRLRQIGPGNLIWNSFSIATRLTWWIRALVLLRESNVALPPEFLARWHHSLARQAQFLSHHLEWDLRANHLLRDAVGLAWAGRYLGGRSARRWLRIAGRIAESQALEQVLPDGGHFERSPMYHIHVLEDFLSLARLLPEERTAQRMRATCAAMAEFTAWAQHPDGTLPLFNDAAQNSVSAPQEILATLAACGVAVPATPCRGLKHFEHTGLVAWRGEPWSLFWDVGQVGPAYQPGHAHADTLTLECSYHGQRLIVDPGTYGYDRDDRRRYDRSTAAHNTVTVAERDSSEVWHIFRVGARARPLGVDVIPRRNGFTAWAAHTGYDQLPGRPRHARQITVDEHGALRINDQVQGTGAQTLAGGWLLSPEWRVAAQESGWKLSSGARSLAVQVDAKQPVTLSVVERPWHPEYGLEVPAPRLMWRATAELPFDLTTTFMPLT